MAVAIIRILNNSPTMKFISGDVLIIIFILFITRLPQSFSTTEAIQPSLTRLDSKRLSPSVQESAAKAVLGRLLPTHLLSFHFKIVSKDVCGGQGCFLIENYDGPTENGPEILIKGTTAVEIASGLHWYIKYFCGAHVSWDKTGGVQLASVPKPGSLPLVKDGGVLIQRPVPWNYYQNVVTSSYSYVWWDWERWEKEIDWMALQGINLPLAFSGQEAIWQKVFMGFNISMEDLNDFFGGPAFLAWARMGNLHTWGGPLSKNWLKQQLVLQKKILSRMAELGMTPVLPSFSGNVPAALKTIFPTANITRLGDWNTVDGDPHWCCTYLLNPSDPLFVEIGEAFIKMQIKAMSNGDKDAVWLMQGWLFYSDSTFWKPPQMKALLHSVPVGKMIVLDLFADVKPIWATSSQFYGTPYVWCLLHNFGGNIEMYGTLDAISSGPVDARISKNSTMVGVGMCMEGIEQNPVVYELMSEMAFRKEKVQVLEWLKTYTHRRYGKSVQQIKEAWAILYHTVYNCTDGIADHNIDFIVKFPDWDPSINFGSRPSKLNSMHTFRLRTRSRRFSFQERSSDLPQAHLWYSTHEVVSALKLFLAAGNDLAGSLTYRYDLVDLTRQVMSKLANQVYLDAINAFRRKDVKALNIHSQKFIQLIKDIDVLLASDDNFLLGTWLESAKLLAENPSEMRQYEWNARTQVTMWFDTTPTNQSKLHDYANKFWSGLLEGYYLPRASSYFSYLSKSLEKNESFKLVEWRKQWISFSNKWQAGLELYPVKAQGNFLTIAKALFDKYLS
ncbi:alpha-N-acetylglucosaminidase isoform X3 [Gossypium hirsutum]|uniref:Alpha-N-acetylglucosaminidase isoform X3 n=1 Tax=Gossypium hirsutum TaxID=3635 RepID=A0A1U8IV42_GOSHI|nr:alpha-N-acetylglucosaminidase isoform X3 [Gossypium hirsutum]